MYAFLIVIGGALALYVPARSISRNGTIAVVKDPIVIFSVYFFTIHFFTPFLKFQRDWFRYQHSYEDASMVLNAVIIIVMFLFAWMASIFFQNRFRVSSIPAAAFDFSGSGPVKVAAIIVYCIGMFFALRDLQSISSLGGGIEDFLRDRHLASQSRSGSRILTNFMIIGGTLFLATCLDKRRQNWVINLAVLAAMYYFAYYYYSNISSRNGIFLMIVFGVAVYCYCRPSRTKISMQDIAKFLLFGASIATVLYYFYSITIDRYSIGDSVYLQERRENALFFMFDGAFGNDEALIWLSENEYEFQWGVTYVAAVTNAIPRSVWAGKPLGAGPRLINMVRPGSYVVGQAGNNSLTTGLLTEGRMNLGIAGMFVAVAGWAWMSSLLTWLAFRSRNPVLKLLFIVAAVSTSSQLLYSEFLGYTVRVILFLVPLGAVYVLSRVSFWPKAKRPMA